MTFRLACLVLIGSILPLQAQVFNSGSTGADGDLTFPNAKSGDTVLFDPNDKTLFPKGVDPNHTNVYNFGVITVPAGVTVRLSGRTVGAAVTWLATGAVNILGTLDLTGEAGVAANAFGLRPQVAPGSGGFYGGIGGNAGNFPPTSGFGPGGGAPGNATGYPVGHGGTFTGNTFLVPLIGGSGGGGGISSSTGTAVEGSGGAGGGAILIASSVSISISAPGGILANGGNSGPSYGGGGSGGAIRLAAPIVNGDGSIQVAGGNANYGGVYNGTPGQIRLEAFQLSTSFSLAGPAVAGTPFDTFVNTTQPTVRVVSVDGVAVNPNPTGTFELPDVTINKGGAVAVIIQCKNVPAGTTVNLQIISENGLNQSINFPALDANLRATASVKFDSGFSRGLLKATFTQ
jgi:hypothetical protein